MAGDHSDIARNGSYVILEVMGKWYKWPVDLSADKKRVTVDDIKDQITEKTNGVVTHVDKLRFMTEDAILLAGWSNIPMPPAFVKVEGQGSIVNCLALWIKRVCKEEQPAIPAELRMMLEYFPPEQEDESASAASALDKYQGRGSTKGEVLASIEEEAGPSASALEPYRTREASPQQALMPPAQLALEDGQRLIQTLREELLATKSREEKALRALAELQASEALAQSSSSAAPSSPPSVEDSERSALSEMLTSFGLEKFMKAFEDLGVEKPRDLQYVDDEDLQEMKMSKIQGRKFKELARNALSHSAK